MEPVRNLEKRIDVLYYARCRIEEEGEVEAEDLGTALAEVWMSLNRGEGKIVHFPQIMKKSGTLKLASQQE